MDKSHTGKKQSLQLFVRGFLVFVVLVLVFAVAYKYFELGKIEENPEIAELQESIREIRSSMNVDSIRQSNIQKIIKIISEYNHAMPSGVKYDIAEEIYNLSQQYTNLDVDLICAAITQESGGTWEPEVVSDAGAYGLMQITPVVGMWVARYENIGWTDTEDVLFNPIYNIRIGCRQLSTFIELYGLKGGLIALDGGEKQAALWLANNKSDGILLAETQNFIPHVLLLYKEYKTIAL